MKKVVVLFLVLAITLAMTVTAFAAVTLAPYTSSDWEEGPGANKGELTPVKHQIIQEGKAGKADDDTHFWVDAAVGDAIPTIDGEVTDNEGYEDFLGYEDYLYVIANTDAYGQDVFDAWYEEVSNWDLVVKACHDGAFLYFYFEYTVKDYTCPINGGALYSWNCIQFDLANANATGSNSDKNGFAVSSLPGNKSITGSWGGNFNPIAGEHYAGKLSDVEGAPTTKKVQHEIKIDLGQALGGTEFKEGFEFKICWVIMANNTGHGSGQRGVSFGHGVTGQESYKEANHFVTLRLVGDGEVEVEQQKEYFTPDEADEKEAYNANGSLYFSEIQKTNDFAGAGITATYMEEDTTDPKLLGGKLGYMKLTVSSGAGLYASAANHPQGLWATEGAYGVVRYRTSTKNMTLGVNFVSTGMRDSETNTQITDFKAENLLDPSADSEIVADGEWHYAVFNFSSCADWRDILHHPGFPVSEGEIDIEGIRFYGWDPHELYGLVEKNTECVCEDWCEDCTGNTETCECQGTCESAEEENNNNNGNNTENQEPTDPTPSEPAKSGCKSVVATSAAFVLVAAVATGALLFKKKKD